MRIEWEVRYLSEGKAKTCVISGDAKESVNSFIEKAGKSVILIVKREVENEKNYSI